MHDKPAAYLCRLQKQHHVGPVLVYDPADKIYRLRTFGFTEGFDVPRKNSPLRHLNHSSIVVRAMANKARLPSPTNKAVEVYYNYWELPPKTT
jgi:hypothetical protein